MKEPELSMARYIPWLWNINDRMKVGQNHIHIARSVKHKLFDQGCQLCQRKQRGDFREGPYEEEHQEILQFLVVSDGRENEVVQAIQLSKGCLPGLGRRGLAENDFQPIRRPVATGIDIFCGCGCEDKLARGFI